MPLKMHAANRPLFVLTVLLLAGCAGSSTTESRNNGGSDEPGPNPSAELQPTDQVDAPTWQIGERFQNHVFFGSEDTEGEHYDAIVAEVTHDAFFLATPDQLVARQDAIVDLPILGDIRRDDLAMSGFGSLWELYDFPLSHDKTWDVAFPNVAWDSITTETVDLEVRSTYAAAIPTSDGPQPGFKIQAHTNSGLLAIEYDYVPSIGWFASLTVYDIDEGDDPIQYRVVSMGHDYGWTGTYYRTEATALLQHLSGTGIDPDDPLDPTVEPNPTATFSVSSQGQFVFGFVGAIAVAGAQEIAIVTPSEQVHHWETVGAPAGDLGFLWEAPAEAGEWRIVLLGAGAVALAFLELYESFEQAETL